MSSTYTEDKGAGSLGENKLFSTIDAGTSRKLHKKN